MWIGLAEMISESLGQWLDERGPAGRRRIAAIAFTLWSLALFAIGFLTPYATVCLGVWIFSLVLYGIFALYPYFDQS